MARNAWASPVSAGEGEGVGGGCFIAFDGGGKAKYVKFIAGQTYQIEAVDGPVVLVGVAGGEDGVGSGREKPRLN